MVGSSLERLASHRSWFLYSLLLNKDMVMLWMVSNMKLHLSSTHNTYVWFADKVCSMKSMYCTQHSRSAVLAKLMWGHLGCLVQWTLLGCRQTLLITTECSVSWDCGSSMWEAHCSGLLFSGRPSAADASDFTWCASRLLNSVALCWRICYCYRVCHRCRAPAISSHCHSSCQGWSVWGSLVLCNAVFPVCYLVTLILYLGFQYAY